MLRLPLSHLLLLSALPTLAAASSLPTPAGPDRWQLCRGGHGLDWIEAPPLDAGQSQADRAQAYIDIDAETIDVSGQDIYILEGETRLRRADQRLRADRLDYVHSAATYRASGAVRYQDARLAVEASHIEGNITADTSRLADVRYQLLALRGNGAAESATLAGPTGDFSSVSYSTCDPAQPSWVLRADRMHLDQERGVGSMRNATLRLGRVPVFWLPYASFPIDDRRRSGFLYPSIGSANDSGIDLRVPYYLNLAPNHDATVSARVLGRRGVALGAEYRYLYAQHGGQIEGDWLPNDDLTGRDRGSARLRHSGRFSEFWSIYADLNHVSDDRYFEDFGDSLAIASTSLLPSQLSVNGRGRYWRASLAAERWEITDPLIEDLAEPYRRLPRVSASWDQPILDWLELRLDAEAIAFSHDVRADATRYDLRPAIRLPFERAWGYLRPEFAWRETGYSLDSDFADSGFAERSPSRSLPVSSLDAALNFERQTTLFGDSYTQTLQPRLYYLRVPFEAQDALPIFDTQELTFDLGQLFRPNRFTGADRQGDGNQATLAVTTRLFDNASGSERLSASLGQIRYFNDQRVQLPGVPARNASGSAYVGELELALSERFALGLSQQWDPEIDATTVTGVSAAWRGRSGALFNMAYRYRRDVLEQTDAAFAIPISAAWRAVGRWNYSLRDDSTLESFAGFEWESCCVAARVLGRHYVRNREGEKNNALYVEIELKGLGSFGRKSGDFLSQAIEGYTRY